MSAEDSKTGMVRRGRDQVPTWVCHLGCSVDSNDVHDERFVSVRNWKWTGDNSRARVNCGATFDICILFRRLRVNTYQTR